MSKRGVLVSVCVIIVFLSLYVFTCEAKAGLVEISVGKETVESFVGATFPITIKKTLKLFGIFEVPYEVRLFNPENIRITPSGEPNALFLHVDVDFELRGGGIFISASEGRASVIMELRISDQKDGLIMNFKRAKAPVFDDSSFDLVPFLNPTTIPLCRVFNVKFQDKNARGEFCLIHLELRNDELLLKGNLTFEKSSNS
ncbi:MAG: hypothetical protein N2317_00760 [Syntrophales bacterium]|nr:hypothetical protein [Syntrophales bacterium]